jgi:hypothetical protein
VLNSLPMKIVGDHLIVFDDFLLSKYGHAYREYWSLNSRYISLIKK